jgi:hypothetical protein
MKLRFLVLFFFAFLGMASKCEKSEEMDKICQKWEFVSSIDPYQGGTVIEADPANKQYKVFQKDGTYLEYDNENDGVGKWAFNADSTHIGTVIITNNDQPGGNGAAVTDFRWEIRELTAQKLVLAIQGRHGFVVYEYKAVK